MRFFIFGAGLLGTLLCRGMAGLWARCDGPCPRHLSNTASCPGSGGARARRSGPRTHVNVNVNVLAVLGRERVLLDFPGAAGERAAAGSVVTTVLPAWMQMTTLGELDGLLTPRVRLLAKALKEAGLLTDLSGNMDGWLKTPVAVVSPIADAVYAAGDDLRVRGHSKPHVIALLHTIRQRMVARHATVAREGMAGLSGQILERVARSAGIVAKPYLFD